MNELSLEKQAKVLESLKAALTASKKSAGDVLSKGKDILKGNNVAKARAQRAANNANRQKNGLDPREALKPEAAASLKMDSKIVNQELAKTYGLRAGLAGAGLLGARALAKGLKGKPALSLSKKQNLIKAIKKNPGKSVAAAGAGGVGLAALLKS